MTTTEETTVTITKLRDAEALAAIPDEVDRLEAAAETAAEARKLANVHRVRRNAAALQLYRAGRPEVEVWRDTLDISRSLWTRMLRDPKNKPGTFDDPGGVARAEAVETKRLDDLAAAAGRVRDETARWLMNAADGPRLRNAEVARISGLTTARVAQLRTSY